MLRATFCHIPDLGIRTEQRLWRMGFGEWDRLRRFRPEFLSPVRYASACAALEESEERLARCDVGYFLKCLPGLHKIRVLEEFAAAAVFLDIETTGLEASADIVVAVACRGAELRYFVQGHSLPRLVPWLSEASVIVTFCGDRFDLPMLRRHFSLPRELPHVDIYPLARAMGYRGTLKACARQAGARRQTGDRLDGARAAALGQRFLARHDLRALRLLLTYCADDVLSLRFLAAKVYARSMEMHPTHRRLHWPVCAKVEYDVEGDALLFDN